MLPSTLAETAGMDSSKASQVEEWATLVSRIICVLGNWLSKHVHDSACLPCCDWYLEFTHYEFNTDLASFLYYYEDLEVVCGVFEGQDFPEKKSGEVS